MFFCIGFVLGIILTGCERGEPPPAAEREPQVVVTAPAPTASAEVAARYGDHVMTVDELTVELQRLPRRSREIMSEEGRIRFVENQILHDLLFDEAVKRGLDQDPEIRRQVDDMNRRLVVQKLVKNLQDVPPATDEEVAAYYQANQNRYSTTTLRARHILVRDEDLAEDLRAKLEANPNSFAELAKQYSIDTASARKGGDLGFFGYGRMVPEFEAAAFALREPGDLSDVVKTQYGYHIIELEERRDGQRKPLDQVREQIRATLHHEAVQKRTQDYYEDLKRNAHVQIDAAIVERVAKNLPEPSSPPGGVSFHGGGH